MKKLEESFPCPTGCPGTVHYMKELRTYKHKGKDVEVTQHFYRCDKCQEQFTTAECDDLTLNQVYNKQK